MVFIAYIVLKYKTNIVGIFDCDTSTLRVIATEDYDAFAKYNFCVQKEFKLLKNIIEKESLFNSLINYKFMPLIFKNNEYLLFEISTGLLRTFKEIPEDLRSITLNIFSADEVGYHLFDNTDLVLSKKTENNLIFYSILPDVPTSVAVETVEALKHNQLALLQKYHALNGHAEFAFIRTYDKALTIKYRTIVGKFLADYNLTSINNLLRLTAIQLNLKGVLTTSYAWCSIIESWRLEKNVGLVYARYNTKVPKTSVANYDIARRLAEECSYLFYAIYLDNTLSRPDIVMNYANINVKRMYSLNSALLGVSLEGIEDHAYTAFVRKCNNFLN